MLNLKFVLFLIFPFLFISCGAPAIFEKVEYVPPLDKVKEYPYGAYIELETKLKAKIYGEFIGISEDKIFVREGETIYFLPLNNISSFVIAVYKPNFSRALGNILIWTLLGTVSTVSHGYWLLYTAPAWILSGIISGGLSDYVMLNASVKRVEKLNKEELNKIILFSRYPQGVPDEIKQKAILFER